MADISTSASLPVLHSADAGFPAGVACTCLQSSTSLSLGRRCNLASAGTVPLKHPWFRWLMASLLCMSALWSPVQMGTAGEAWSALSSWFLLCFGHTSVPWLVQPVRPPLVKLGPSLFLPLNFHLKWSDFLYSHFLIRPCQGSRLVHLLSWLGNQP